MASNTSPMRRLYRESSEGAIASFTSEKVRVKAAGRTDAGVHAKGQVVAFDTSSRHSADAFVQALNYYLPEEIAIKAPFPLIRVSTRGEMP